LELNKHAAYIRGINTAEEETFSPKLITRMRRGLKEWNLMCMFFLEKCPRRERSFSGKQIGMTDRKDISVAFERHGG
jgi:hypothetical protein